VLAAGADGAVTLAVDSDVPERVTFYEGQTFWVENASTGRPEFGGRLVRDPRTRNITALQIGGRLAPRGGGLAA